MRNEIVEQLVEDFNKYSNVDENGVEFWYARDLQNMLGYSKWSNFELIIKKAKISCETSKIKVLDHFADVSKMVSIGSDTKRSINDYKLTRYACYLIAQNGDPRKERIAFAQTYFAVQTRNMEIIQQKLLEYERLQAREKLTETEKLMSGLIYEKGVKDSKGFARIRSEGDKVLFGGNTTANMKNRLAIKQSEPLADYLPTVTLKAKDLAAEMTNHKLRTTTLYGEVDITDEHKNNNRNVRKALTDSSIYPEDLPKEESIKKLKTKVKKDKKALEKSKI